MCMLVLEGVWLKKLQGHPLLEKCSLSAGACCSSLQLWPHLEPKLLVQLWVSRAGEGSPWCF